MKENKNNLTEALKMRCMRNLETSRDDLSALLTANEYGNIKVFYDEGNQLLGYIAWASMNKESLNLLKQSPYLPRYSYEFNEGKLMVIFDVVLHPISSKKAQNALVQYLKEKRFVAILKRKKLHTWTRKKGKHLRNFFVHDKPRFPTPLLREALKLENEIVVEKIISPKAISIVVPVKNNQRGVDRFLNTIIENMNPETYPGEVIIVDNNSDKKVFIAKEFPFPVTVVECKQRGPGAARNLGVATATGKWILFTDSDCVATPTLVSGYSKIDNECVAYAGMIDIKGNDDLNSYYREQEILIPQKIHTANGVFPWTIVTANCLVLKSAFTAIQGFNEKFIYAGGEDTDLGFRLRMVGKVHYNFNSVAIHEFNDGFSGFVARFIRYGRGGYLMDQLYAGLNFHSIKITTSKRSKTNKFLADAQEKAWNLGYQAENYKDFV